MSKWRLDEILAINLKKNLPFRLKRYIFENFKCFDHLINSKLTSDLAFHFRQEKLFSEGQSHKELLEAGIREIEQATKAGVRICTVYDDDYPFMLKQTSHPPLVLYYSGVLQKSESICISIVGTRKHTLYGKLSAERFASYIAGHNIIVVSGLAYGIDTVSHLSAIDAGGVTYAVIAAGIDKLSPKDTRRKADMIIERGGAIISDYPMGTRSLPAYFLQRNRIIAGLSLATIIIESDIKGGSLNTARHAFDLGREVFSLPGNITSVKSKGTNMLIKNEKAIPALSPEMILGELGLEKEKQVLFQQSEKEVSNPEQKIILENIDFEPLHVDEISEKCGIDISALLVSLLELEFQGFIRQLPGKYYIKNHR